ncbi:hypothetical protein STEG23_013654 [Scotinomys teguina]
MAVTPLLQIHKLTLNPQSSVSDFLSILALVYVGGREQGREKEKERGGRREREKRKKREREKKEERESQSSTVRMYSPSHFLAGAASHPGKKRTKEQPVTLRGRGPRSSQSPSEEEDPGAASHPQRKRTKEQPVTLRGRGPRSTQTPSEQETFPAPSSKAEMGRCKCKSTYNNIKNKTSPESSPPPTPRPEHCNVDKAEENDLKNSLMNMIEEALEGKMKNAIKEIEEKTNKKLKENNKEIEEKNKKK